MRTSLMISLVLLAATLGFGWLEEGENRLLSQRYVSAAEEMRIMAAKSEWDRAGEAATAYLTTWQDTSRWLQMLINHEDIDDVTLALERLRAAIEAQDQAACYETCAELRENARHIYHRDAFTLGNIL